MSVNHADIREEGRNIMKSSWLLFLVVCTFVANAALAEAADDTGEIKSESKPAQHNQDRPEHNKLLQTKVPIEDGHKFQDVGTTQIAPERLSNDERDLLRELEQEATRKSGRE